MTSLVSVNHTFEAGHRLYPLGGKCESLHGHSWKVEVTITGELQYPVPIIGDFSSLKKSLRDFVDTYLDHGMMLGFDDPLRDDIIEGGSKVFTFGHPNPIVHGELLVQELEWPTVEAVAILIGKFMVGQVADGIKVQNVVVTETPTNKAIWVNN